MAPLGYIWKIVTNIVYTVTLSPFWDYASPQTPVGNAPQVPHVPDGSVHSSALFRPPGTNIDGFLCDYSAMPGWESCWTESDKSCWLTNKQLNRTYTVYDNWENITLHGTTRKHTLCVEDGWWNADGMNFTEAKMINGTLPGPLIEACWGDTLEVTIVNKMKFNGTSIHWHGLRQHYNTQHDGVNGVTQCPIAPGDSYTYKIHLTQYGTSWLHSHFSVQYADGVQAPLTIHGPTSDNYDHAIAPLMISDWGHNSGFDAIFTKSLANGSLIMNGKGNLTKYSGCSELTDLKVPEPTVVAFNYSKGPTGNPRYLLRVINSAYESGLVFTIDNHMLQVVEVDFVPIVSNLTYNYTRQSVLIGIGQRLHVIVEALDHCIPKKDGGKAPADCNFWIRTIQATGCASDPSAPPGGGDDYSAVGILRYDACDTSVPTSTQYQNLELRCIEDYAFHKPTWPWKITEPSNSLPGASGQILDVNPPPPPGTPYPVSFLYFSNDTTGAGYNFKIDYGNPTFLNLGTAPEMYPNMWMVIPENYTSENYVYVVINDSGHPIHLHGHDFAIIKRNFTNSFDPSVKLSCDAEDEWHKLDCDNPVRRDVFILPGYNPPGNGYAIIAFKTDNPGTWLMHCHIAFHASGGLAVQFMERQTDAYDKWPLTSPAAREAQRVCKNWNDFSSDCANLWPGVKYKEVLDKNGRCINKVPYYPSCIDNVALENDSGV